MEPKNFFDNVSSSDCGCCQTVLDDIYNAYGCHDRSRVFTKREEAVLQRIREASQKAREIKKLMNGSGGDAAALGDRKMAFVELENLRRERSRLEEERIAAASERMRLLGHE